MTVVRQVAPRDWQLWRDLRLRALADAPDSFGELLEQAAARADAGWAALAERQPDRVQLVAERDGSAVGMVVVRIAADDGRRANVYAMWVAPEARHHGVGRQLISRAVEWARARAVSELELRVSEAAAAARGLYRAAGFVDTRRREPVRPGSGLESLVLIARLPPLVMGVVNVTPDSFSDGGQFLDPAVAIGHGLALREAGADILDVGGEATNPRAAPVDVAEELRRVIPVIERLAAAGATVSIDTTKAAVARAAAAAGAAIINDVSGGLFDPAMAQTVAELDVTYIAGHVRGHDLGEVFAAEQPDRGTRWATWEEVARELEARLATLAPAVRLRCWVDPGIGFGKGADPDANVKLLTHAGDLQRAVGRPVVVGPSRKRFLRTLIGASADTMALDAASVAACLGAASRGAQVLRVHNVALLEAALAVYTRI